MVSEHEQPQGTSLTEPQN
jgi:hypothetical protein